MDMPALLPTDLDYCSRLRGEEQIIPALLSRSDEHLIRFVEAATDDETWAAKHPALIKGLFSLITREFSSKRLRVEHAQRVVTCIQQHFDAYKAFLPIDLRINTGKKRWAGNTLLFGTNSLYFRQLIEPLYHSGKVLDVNLDNIPEEVYVVVEEFLFTGAIRDLWKRPEGLLMRILVQAGQWQIRGLERLCADVLKRYVTSDTASMMLKIAQHYVLPELKEACCEVLNRLPLGLHFVGLGDAELIVTINEFNERGTPLLMEVASGITHLVLRERVGEEAILQQLLSKCSCLMSLDLTGTKECAIEIFDLIPGLRELTLTNCTWLDNGKLAHILTRQHDLNRLVLSENPQLGYEGFRKIANLATLESFIATYCEGLEDGHIEMIARSCENLLEVNVSWSPKITDMGVRALGALRPELKIIDISHCTKVSDAGVHDLVRPCFQLERLGIQQCPKLTEDGIIYVPNLSLTIKYLDIRLCDITLAGVEVIRERYPRLQVIF